MSIGVSDKRNETKTPMNGLGRGRSPTRSVGARATAERSEAVRGAEGAEKPLYYNITERVEQKFSAVLSMQSKG